MIGSRRVVPPEASRIEAGCRPRPLSDDGLTERRIHGTQHRVTHRRPQFFRIATKRAVARNMSPLAPTPAASTAEIASSTRRSSSRRAPSSTERSDQRALVLTGVLAGAFAERRRVAFHVENVVGDLKRGANRAPISGKRRTRCRVRACQDRPRLDAELQKRAGLHRLQAPDLLEPKAAPSTARRRCPASARPPCPQDRRRAQGPDKARRARPRSRRSRDRRGSRTPAPAARRRRESLSPRRTRGASSGVHA